MMADDTAAVIEKLGLGPVDVVGHSDGADLALILARNHPRMVRRLVISGANIRVELSAEEKQRAQWTPQQLAGHLREVADRMPPWFFRYSSWPATTTSPPSKKMPRYFEVCQMVNSS